jgi:hypothetical protein
MQRDDSSKRVLGWAALSIALLPILVFATTDWFLDAYGRSAPGPPEKMAGSLDGHAEAAGRIQVLAFFILVMAGALAACLLFVRTLAKYPRQPARRLLLTYISAVAIGGILVWAMNTSETQDYVGANVVCAALSPGGVPITEAQPSATSGPLYPDAPTRAARCDAPRFRLLRGLLFVERNLLILSIAALALGTISCLALPAPDDKPDENKRLLARIVRVQADRLQLHLYLSAALLVMGLLFLGAFLRWPSYIYDPPDDFLAHANAVILYLGISYSILLASYYVPVALLLSRAARRSGDAEVASQLASRARSEPLNAAKVAGAIFAPALVSILSGFLDLS